MTKKVEWVNILKGIGILFVVLGHLNTPMSKFIFSWHMPFFFFISGFFISGKLGLKQLILKNFKRIMIPYFMFGLFGIVVEIFKRSILAREMLDHANVFKGLLWSMDAKDLLGHYGFLLWFLPTLFWGRSIIQFLLNRKINNFLIFLLSIIFFIFSFKVELPFGLDNGLGNIIWMFMGYFFFNKLSSIDLSKSYFFIGLSAIVITVSLLHYPFLELDIATKFYSQLGLNILWAMAMILFFISFSQQKIFKHKTFNFLKELGEKSMFIYLMHPYTNNIAYLMGKNISWFVYTLVALVFVLLLMKIRNHLPSWRILNYV